MNVLKRSCDKILDQMDNGVGGTGTLLVLCQQSVSPLRSRDTLQLW